MHRQPSIGVASPAVLFAVAGLAVALMAFAGGVRSWASAPVLAPPAAAGNAGLADTGVGATVAAGSAPAWIVPLDTVDGRHVAVAIDDADGHLVDAFSGGVQVDDRAGPIRPSVTNLDSETLVVGWTGAPADATIGFQVRSGSDKVVLSIIQPASPVARSGAGATGRELVLVFDHDVFARDVVLDMATEG